MDASVNPIVHTLKDGRVAVRAWVDGVYLEPKTHQQALATTRARGVVLPIALMPDAHFGMGAAIGSVVATQGSIIPSSVGVDLGCGMSAVRLDLDASRLPDDLSGVLSAFARSVPTMRHDRQRPGKSPGRVKALKWLQDTPIPSDTKLMGLAGEQMGTLGGGNHFVELSLDTQDRVWIVLHSGSRGVGNKLANHHIRIAKACDKAAPTRDLAALMEGSAEFNAYCADMLWAQEYAYQNREAMMSAVVEAFRDAVSLPHAVGTVAEQIRCHHNYAEREVHDGQEVWITRKGAIRARVGDKGIIPGSMGTSTYLVAGLGNADSYCSAAHGAGRTMSRSQAKTVISEADLRTAMQGRVWLEGKAGSLVDEAPQAYKDIHAVMDAQSDLCEPIEELVAVVNYKGTN